MPANKIKRFPMCYKEIFKKWSENLFSFPNLPSAIASQVIWYNKCIKVDNRTIYNFKMSRKDTNYVGQLVKCNCKPKFNILGQLQFINNQIIHAIRKSWKDALVANFIRNVKNLVFQSHQVIKSYQIYCLNKSNSPEIYSILIDSDDSKPSSQLHCKFFQNSNLDWEVNYVLPCIVTKVSRLREFQYKLLNKALYLNEIIFRFGKIDSAL